jgi:cytochrome P450
LSAGIMLLARNPEQASLLRSDPDRYLRPFAEEVLRLESPVQQLFRIAAVDAEVGGVAIPAGALVSVCYAAANRDPRQFDCPREMNINRASPGAHLTFGSGIHHCLGAPLARRELYWGFKALIDELDNIQLDESKNDYLHIPSMMLRALNVLHITFDRKHK